MNSLLEGSAREAVSGLALTAANYHEAIAILQKRFGSRQQIISKHMDILLNVEPVTSSHNIKGLRHLYDFVESHIRSLKSLGVISESYGSLLSPVLLNKLPSEMRLIVSREVPEKEWGLDALMKVMGKEVEARERIAMNSSQTQQRRTSDRSPSTAATLVSGASPSNPSCCYCQQAHSSSSCGVVTSIDSRKQILKRSGRCFSCLRRGHISRECRSVNKCPKCGGRHHASICSKNSTRNPVQQAAKPANNAPLSQQPTDSTSSPTHCPGLNPNATTFATPSTTTLCVDPNKAVLLQTALADIYNPLNPHNSCKARMILDSGSQRSYITARAKGTLSLKSVSEQCLSIAAFGSRGEDPKMCEIVRVGVRSKFGPDKELTLFVVPHICDALTAQPISVCAETYSHLAQLDLADASDGHSQMEVDILVGCDYYWDFITGQTIRGEGGPVAIQTRLGWVLSGPVNPVKHLVSTVNLVTTHVLRINSQPHGTKELDDTLQSFWRLESLGICTPERSVYDDFASSIQFKQGRYEVALPWKEGHAPLPQNYELCRRRLHGLLHRLWQQPTILQEYDTIIRDQLAKGIVQVVTNSEGEENENVHYLPHHAVIRSDKNTTKVRIVYDASARSSGPSLNDCLHTGPKFDQKILDILLRFRSHRVALTADIEKAFLMISVTERDRDVLRFLWIDDISKVNPEVVTLRFARVVFGVSSSPFLLNATIKHHVEKFSSSHPELVKELLRSIYVDDVVFGAHDEESTYKLYTTSKSILESASFNLRKFATNSPTLQQRINEAEGVANTETGDPQATSLDETYAKYTLGAMQQVQLGEQKILGVRWDVSSDQVLFDFGDIARLASDLEPTKRNVVSLVGRFYDPMGFTSPVTIRFKILFQELCESKVDWDHPLTGKLLTKWKSLIADLQEGQVMSIPRCYFDGIDGEVISCRLCGFCDASVNAYAAVVYLIIQTDGGNISKFVTSKTRVAPLQRQTIPRLELLSALLLARLMSSVTDSLSSQMNLMQPRCFTDSQVALFWIVGKEKEWRPFVQNRVNEVRSLMPIECWSHCSGKDNPADVPSRGLTPLELSVNLLWRNGPKWLSDVLDDREQQTVEMPEECITEMKAADRRLTHGLLTTNSAPSLQQIMKCEDYSNLPKLLRVTANILKFVRLLKRKVKPADSNDETPEQPDDIELAERLWIIESQSSLSQDKSFEMWKRQFNLFVDANGVWRCGGRLENADLPYSTKYPVLLSRKHYLTILIVKDAHGRVQHNGVKDTLTEIRSKYWIVKGRSLVRTIIHQCVTCRRFEGRPFQGPPPPPLPPFRVKEEPPFSCTAVDFAGPLYIKAYGVTKDSKTWICLYTCCVTRAVHLDVVPDLSTHIFIRSLKRFCARRGLPHKFLSDNGKTFKAAAKVLESIMDQQDVKLYLSQIGVKWCFNLERAPWWGGVFERLIKTMKRCLRKMIGQAKFTYDELITAVTEVEAIVNSRPLSYVSSEDVEEPLTPSHLLVGRRILSLPDNLCYQRDINDDDFEVDSDHLNKRVKHLNNVINHFWKRWRHEYLLELRESHRTNQGESRGSPIATGDIVLVHDEHQPRGFWKLAQVKETIVGKDGRVRGAVLKLSTKDGQATFLRRPLQLLYPLEINCHFNDPAIAPNDTSSAEDVGIEQTDNEVPIATRRQSQRLAARQANDQLKACLFELEEN